MPAPLFPTSIPLTLREVNALTSLVVELAPIATSISFVAIEFSPNATPRESRDDELYPTATAPHFKVFAPFPKATDKLSFDCESSPKAIEP